MLVDDNMDHNFIHERVIKKAGKADEVVAKSSAGEALQFLADRDSHDGPHPDLIFLDINMPDMNGWEFLEHYKDLDASLQSKVVIIMLSTSEDPDDKLKAQKDSVCVDFMSKPLTKQVLEEVLEKYF